MYWSAEYSAFVSMNPAASAAAAPKNAMATPITTHPNPNRPIPFIPALLFLPI